MIRKKNICVDKMYFMNFKFEKVFYFRLLLSNRKKNHFFRKYSYRECANEKRDNKNYKTSIYDQQKNMCNFEIHRC